MRRSVLLITLDRWPRSLLGLHGNPWIDTPTANTLAAEGAVFEQHLVGTFNVAGQITPIEQVMNSLQQLKSDPHVQFCYAREEQATPTSLNADLRQPGSWATATVVAELPCVPLFHKLEKWLADELHADTSLIWVHSAGVPEQRPIPEELSLWYQEEWEELGIPLSTVFNSDQPRLHPAEQGGAATLLDAAIGRLIAAWKQHVDSGVIVLGGLRGGGSVYTPPHERTAGVPGETVIAEAELPLIVAGYRRSTDSNHTPPSTTPDKDVAEIFRPGTRSVQLSTWGGLARLLQHTLQPAKSPPTEEQQGAPVRPMRPPTEIEDWNKAFTASGAADQRAVFQRLKLSSGEPALSVRTVGRVALFPLSEISQPVISDLLQPGISAPPAGSFLFRLPSDRGGLHSLADQQPDQLQALWALTLPATNQKG